MVRLNKPEKSRVLYDWANSAYSIAVTTALRPIFFKHVKQKYYLPGEQKPISNSFKRI